MKRRKLIGGFVAVAAALVFATTALTYSGTRIAYTGNKVCTDFGYANGFKIDRQNPNGTFSDGTHSVTITLHSNTNPISFDFTAATPHAFAVLVKAGNGGYMYQYPGAGVESDFGLESTTPDQISHLEICYGAPPTSVGLKRLNAQQTSSGVVIRWRTGSEITTLGFNVYRELAGKRVKLNRTLIRASSSADGRAYSWVDHRSAPGARYWLQDLSLRGVRTWHGPASAHA